MGVPAASFEVRADSAAPVVAAIHSAVNEVTNPAGVMVFCSGALAGGLHDIAERLSDLKVPALLLSGPGVLSERGELEGVDAATGLVWGGGQAQLSLCESEADLTSVDISRLLPSARVPTGLFIRSEGFDPEQLWSLRRKSTYPFVFGAGIHGDPGIVCVDGGAIRCPRAVSMRLAGLAPPSVLTAHSCRLLSPPMTITSNEGAMVEALDGQPALAVLERLGAELSGQPLVFTVLAREDDEQGQELLVRGIQGIDPDAGSLLISQQLDSELRLTFAVRDSGAAREDIARVSRAAARSLAGAAPRFALYFNCSGRGQSLHGSVNVDTRVLREHFPSVPIAGLQSAFEIGPFGGAPALQLYTGILAVFGSPS